MNLGNLNLIYLSGKFTRWVFDIFFVEYINAEICRWIWLLFIRELTTVCVKFKPIIQGTNGDKDIASLRLVDSDGSISFPKDNPQDLQRHLNLLAQTWI